MSTINKTVDRKVGLNRGKKRIWIEGKDVHAAGFLSGLHFTAEFKPGLITLELKQEGNRKVSGKAKVDGTPHPIIDLIGEKVAESVGNAEMVRVTYQDGLITIVAVQA